MDQSDSAKSTPKTSTAANTGNMSNTSAGSTSSANSGSGYVWPISRFLSKFSDWKFCPPSSHLWTVSILLSSRSDNSSNTISALYNNICAVNDRFSSLYGSKWKVEAPADAASFIAKNQDSELGIFLATEIDFNTYDVSLDIGDSSSGKYHSGFLTYGKMQVGRKQGVPLKIRFLRSNWDFCELFFDKWIAAVCQQGLIESDELPNIKATIIIQEYAASVPGGTAGVWFPKKQITLNKTVPISRENTKYTYDSDKAGLFMGQVITFDAESYQIKYLDLPAVNS